MQRFGPRSPIPWAIALSGLATAVVPWLVAGGSFASELGHSLVGGGMLFFGLWNTWRPVVITEGEALHYQPRFGSSLRLQRSEVEVLLAPTPTGNPGADHDLIAQVGVRTAAGFVWLDLRDLRRADRRQVRSWLQPGAP